MVMVILAITLLAASLGFGQPHNPGVDPAYLGHFIRSSSTAQTPDQLPNAATFLTYEDFSIGSTTTSWTNRVAPHNVFVTQGTASTVTTNGMTLVGTLAGSFINSTPGPRWAGDQDSIWIVFDAVSFTGYYDNLLASAFPGGNAHGLFVYDGSGSMWLSAPPGAVLTTITTGVRCELVIAAAGLGTSKNIYTNGVFQSAYATPCNWTHAWWGIGGDAPANGDQYWNGHIKFLGQWTNHMLTPAEISTLHTYATSH